MNKICNTINSWEFVLVITFIPQLLPFLASERMK